MNKSTYHGIKRDTIMFQYVTPSLHSSSPRSLILSLISAFGLMVLFFTLPTYAGTISLVTDPSLIFSVPSVPTPFYQSSITDPTFRTKITRIANNTSQPLSPIAGTWGSDARHHYSKDQPWNSDNTLLMLDNNRSPYQVILDGETYESKYGPCSNYLMGDARWHPSPQHPHERISVKNNTLQWFDVVSCKQTRSWILPFPVDYFGSGEGNPSADGRYALLADATRMFVVDMDPQPPYSGYPNKRIGPAYNFSTCGLSDCTVDWVSISPSGKYAVIQYKEGMRVFDVGPYTLALTPRRMPITSPRCSGRDPTKGYIYDLGHADMAKNPFDNNEDVIVGQGNRAGCPSQVGGVSMGGVVMVRLKDNKVTTLTDPKNEAWSFHVSTRNYDRPGWAYVSYWPGSGRRFNDEIIAVKMDGSKSVERLAHTHSNANGCYRCEPHPVPSRDGRRVLWASNWAMNCGSSCGSSSDIKAYVVDTQP
jgi:hypothetical protein